MNTSPLAFSIVGISKNEAVSALQALVYMGENEKMNRERFQALCNEFPIFAETVKEAEKALAMQRFYPDDPEQTAIELAILDAIMALPPSRSFDTVIDLDLDSDDVEFDNREAILPKAA